jgi:HSP20 family protein
MNSILPAPAAALIKRQHSSTSPPTRLMQESNAAGISLRQLQIQIKSLKEIPMTYYIAPYAYRMARRWAQMADCQPDYNFRLAVDVREEDNAYVISALTPGLKAEDLNIQILDDVVTIEGEFKFGEQEYMVSELPHGSFHRTLELPASVDAEKAEASIVDGVLTLRLPKVESARPKTIKVAVK